MSRKRGLEPSPYDVKAMNKRLYQGFDSGQHSQKCTSAGRLDGGADPKCIPAGRLEGGADPELRALKCAPAGRLDGGTDPTCAPQLDGQGVEAGQLALEHASWNQPDVQGVEARQLALADAPEDTDARYQVSGELTLKPKYEGVPDKSRQRLSCASRWTRSYVIERETCHQGRRQVCPYTRSTYKTWISIAPYSLVINK